MLGNPLSTIVVGPSSSAIILLYPAILRSGAQSVTADRNTYYSDDSDKYKGVRQQGIIKY